MRGQAGLMEVGTVSVHTTSGRGMNAEEWADLCMQKILYVGDQSIPAIRDQAQAYQTEIKKVLVHYFSKAIRSDRTTLYNILLKQGHKDIADIIHKL